MSEAHIQSDTQTEDNMTIEHWSRLQTHRPQQVAIIGDGGLQIYPETHTLAG